MGEARRGWGQVLLWGLIARGRDQEIALPYLPLVVIVAAINGERCRLAGAGGRWRAAAPPLSQLLSTCAIYLRLLLVPSSATQKALALPSLRLLVGLALLAVGQLWQQLCAC